MVKNKKNLTVADVSLFVAVFIVVGFVFSGETVITTCYDSNGKWIPC